MKFNEACKYPMAFAWGLIIGSSAAIVSMIMLTPVFLECAK